MPRPALRMLLLLFLPALSFAQTPRVDSLKKLLAVQKDSTARMHTLLALCDQKESLPGDSIYAYSSRAVAIARIQNDQPQLLLAEYYILLSKANKGALDSVLEADNRILPGLSYASGRDLFIKFTLQKARVYIKTARYKEAQATLYTLLTEGEKAGDVKTLAYAMTYIGWTHMEMEQLSAALEWFRKAEAELHAKPSGLDYSPLYSNMAAVLDDMGKHDSAWQYIQVAINSSQQQQNLAYLANAFAIQSDILVHLKRNPEAETSLNKAIAIRRQIGDPFYILSDMAALASLYAADNKSAAGIPLAKEGIALARQYHFSPKELYLSEALAENYKAAGDYKGYSEVLKSIITLKDTLYQQNSHEALAEMQAKYESQKKEKTILEQKYTLEHKNYFIYGLTILLIATLFIGMMVFEIRRHRQTGKVRQAEKDNNKRRLEAVDEAREEERKRILADLHDELGSGLSSIRIMSDLMTGHPQQQEQVSRYAQKISDISRNTIQGMNTIIWALNNDNDSVHNLCEFIGKFGHGLFENSNISFHLIVPETLPDLELSGAHRKNLFLCVKESLHNILKHSGARNAEVIITVYAQRLLVFIGDDGKGPDEQNKFGNGLKNITRRMQEINGEAGFIHQDGFEVQLIMPLVPRSLLTPIATSSQD